MLLLLHSHCSIPACCHVLITMLLLLLSHSASYHYDLIAALLLPYACCCPHCLSLLHSYCFILIAMLLLLYVHCFLSVAMFSSLHSCCQTFAMVLLLPLLCSCHCIFFLSLFLPSYSHFCPMFILIPHFQISPSHSIPCHVSCSILCVLSHSILHFILPSSSFTSFTSSL